MKAFQGPSAPAKAQPAFEANAFDLIILSRLSFSKEKLKALSAPAKAKPAFEAQGFDFINSYRRRCWDSQVRLVSTQQV